MEAFGAFVAEALAWLHSAPTFAIILVASPSKTIIGPIVPSFPAEPIVGVF